MKDDECYVEVVNHEQILVEIIRTLSFVVPAVYVFIGFFVKSMSIYTIFSYWIASVVLFNYFYKYYDLFDNVPKKKLYLKTKEELDE